jgi:outer membrane receptor protein involved in Fe transport
MGAVTLWALAASAAAQDPAAADRSAQPAADNPEMIIVTGERVKRTLKDTPSSVMVFDKRDMERLAAPDRLQQLLELAPNVLVPTSRDTPVIRGQSGVGVLAALPAFLGGARPRTVMQIDGRTVTFNEFVNSAEGLWDVDHVEVFRSPQTTTQGVNSIAGAILIHTADPSFDYEGQARVIAGQSSRRQASALVSGPLVRDQLAFRLSADVYQAYSSTSMHGPVVGARDLNIDHYWTVRAKLLAQPSGVPGLKLLTTYAHTHSQAPQAELAQSPFGKRRDDNYVFGYFKSDVDSVTGTITYPLADGLESRTTLSAGRSHFQRFAPQGFGQTQIHARDESAETVLDWKPAGRVSAIGGISFQQVKLGQFINLARANLGVGSFDDRQRSAGVFGELTWLPAERLSVTAGARYQSDSKKRVGVLRMLPPLPLDYDKSTHAFLPKVSIGYDLSSNWRVGLLVQRAYNPGGVTLDPAHRAQLEFKPEYLWDYEAFTRASLLGGLVTLTGNLFYNRMRDAQRELDFDLNSPGGHVGLLQIISEPRAHTYGAELEGSAQPTRRLTVRAGIGLLNTRITQGIAPNDPFLGKEFAGAPHFTATAAAEWSPALGFSLAAQLRHTSSYWGDDSENALFRTGGWSILDARATWRHGSFKLFGYAQNIFDKFHIIGWSGPRDDPTVHVGLVEPRELGVGVEGRF